MFEDTRLTHFASAAQYRRHFKWICIWFPWLLVHGVLASFTKYAEIVTVLQQIHLSVLIALADFVHRNCWKFKEVNLTYLYYLAKQGVADLLTMLDLNRYHFVTLPVCYCIFAEVIKKYSNFVGVPIFLNGRKVNVVQVWYYSDTCMFRNWGVWNWNMFALSEPSSHTFHINYVFAPAVVPCTSTTFESLGHSQWVVPSCMGAVLSVRSKLETCFNFPWPFRLAWTVVND